MDNDPNDSKTGIRKFLDSLLVRVPELVLAFVGGFGVLIFSIWLSNRDLLSRIADIDDYIEKDRSHMEQLANCVKREECEAVRAVLHAHELRVTKLEGEFAGHEKLARERIERIGAIESEVRQLAATMAARQEHYHSRSNSEIRSQ
jgi:hypothetical protein